MVDIQTVSIVFAAASVVLGIAYYIFDLRDKAKAKQTDLVMELFSHFGSREYQESWQRIMTGEFKDYDDFVRKHGLADTWEVAMLFEGMGLLVQRKLVDIDTVDDLISGPIKSTWEKIAPIIEGYRRQSSQPQFCEWFEYLYNRIESEGQRLKWGKRTKLQQSKA